MLKALLWKEWQEQRWRVALACVWLLGPAAIGLKTRIMPDAEILGMLGMLAALILPVFIGMGLFASERKNGTLVYLMAQPISRGRILVVKVIAGLLACLIPMTVCGITVCLAVGGREIGSADIVSAAAAVTVLGLILFVWQLLSGLRCRREETYIFVSAVVLVCWFLHAGLNLGFWISALNPIAIIGAGTEKLHLVWVVVAVQSVILTGLAFGLWIRFRRIREGRS
jgi:ABC-type transport system involved in multi-copper enzyme maturation permease subunit